jgi:hypothetical protein
VLDSDDGSVRKSSRGSNIIRGKAGTMRNDRARTRGVLHHLKGNAIAYVALFFALGGAAYGAKPLLTGADIQDGTVASIDIKDGDLRAADVAPDGLTGAVIDESTLTLPAGDTVTGSHHWPMLIGGSPSETGTTWSIGDWTVTPTCVSGSSGGVSLAVTGPSGFSTTKFLPLTSDVDQTASPVFPGPQASALASSLLLGVDYRAQSFGFTACFVTIVGAQVKET